MSAALIALPLALALAALLAAGLLSGDCAVAVTVACLRVRYALGPAEAAAGLTALLGAAFACTAAGSGTALTVAGNITSRWAERAAVTLIPAPEGLLDG